MVNLNSLFVSWLIGSSGATVSGRGSLAQPRGIPRTKETIRNKASNMWPRDAVTQGWFRIEDSPGLGPVGWKRASDSDVITITDGTGSVKGPYVVDARLISAC